MTERSGKTIHACVRANVQSPTNQISPAPPNLVRSGALSHTSFVGFLCRASPARSDWSLLIHSISLAKAYSREDYRILLKISVPRFIV